MPIAPEEQGTLGGEARERVEELKGEITQNILDPSLHTPDIPLSPHTSFLFTTNKVLQALSRILGYNRKWKKWQGIWVDDDGRLQTLSYDRPVSQWRIWSNYAVGTSINRIIAATGNLVDIVIKNRGATTIYLGNTIGFTPINRWSLAPNESIHLRRYIGEVYAQSSAAGGIIDFYYTYLPREAYLPPPDLFEAE